MLDTDESIDVACPNCGHKNALEVSDAETHSHETFVCVGCKQEVSVDTSEFQERMKKIRAEIESLKHAAGEKPRKSPKGGSWQI